MTMNFRLLLLLTLVSLLNGFTSQLGEPTARSSPDRLQPCSKNRLCITRRFLKNIDEDPDESILVRITGQTVALLMRPSIASLPTVVLLALIATPFFLSVFQTILSFVLFAALAVLGRLATNDEPFEKLQQQVREDKNEPPSYGTDVFAFLFAASSSYLIIPSSATNTQNSLNLSEISFGLGVLVATIAVLSQTTGELSTEAVDKSDQINGVKGANGINGELLDKWDRQLKVRELEKRQVKDDD